MNITLNEFIDRIAYPEAEIFVLATIEMVAFDSIAQIVYIPVTTHNSSALNTVGDFRTIIGHGLLWSRHIEVDCNSFEMGKALQEQGYVLTPIQAAEDYCIYTAEKAIEMAEINQ